MKADIHPPYYDVCEIRCSCGNVIVTGSTKEKMRTELCSRCHPFYTGQQKLVDTAGRVDKFRAKMKTAELHKIAKKEAEIAKKTRPKVAEKPKAKAVPKKKKK